MRLVGLVSGGKDSFYNILQCFAAGHEVVAIANIEPSVKRDDMDSYMYQTVGNQILSLISEAVALPIYRQKTKGIAICKEKVYVETAEDEVEDLFALLANVKDEMNIEGVSVGTIASDYQRTRVENVCLRLNLKCYAFLWKRDQHELLQEMIDSNLHAIIVKVATLGLKPDLHLGISIKDVEPLLHELHNKFGINVCGEGGEYETLTVDCPLFHRRIDVIQSEKVVSSDDAFAPVGYLSIKSAGLENKVESVSSVQSRIKYIRKIIKPPTYYIQDCLDDMTNKFFSDNYGRPQRTSSEILPHPFELSSKIFDESKNNISDYRKRNANSLTSYNHVKPHSSHTVTFSPSLLLDTDTTIIQVNHSTGWCCIGNITGPNIKEALDFGRKHLEIYNYELRDVVSVSLFVHDMNEWTKINKVYSQSFPNYCPPTRSLVSVPLSKDVGVLVTLVAHKVVSNTQKFVQHMQHNLDRDVINVQSISHWAPANIGPYSQCVRVGKIIYVAGQIPLIPGTMELLNKSILHQCRLTLRHVFRIMLAVNECYTLANIMHGICFVTSSEIARNILDLWSYVTHNEHAAIGVVVVLSLPMNAQLEWFVLASGYSQPQVDSSVETVSDDFLLNRKRCLYLNNNTSAAICNVSYVKKTGKSDINLTSITADNIIAIMRHCLQYLRGDMVKDASLCMFNVFYKSSEPTLASIINEALKVSHDFQVVINCIPVVACFESDVFLTISGVCH